MGTPESRPRRPEIPLDAKYWRLTLGTYPEGGPPRFLIPLESLESDYPQPPFTDIAPAAGTAVSSLAGGGGITDFNNDGWLDLMVSSWSLDDQVQLLINPGDGTFGNRTGPAGI